MTDNDVFVFDTSPIEKDVKIDGVNYKLREASGEATAAWRNAQIRGGRWHQKPKGESLLSIVSEELGNTEAVLVGACLFRCKDTNPDETFPAPVGEQVVRRFPNRVIKPMFNWVMEVSDLREREEEDQDQDPTSKQPISTMDGSG